MTPGFQLLVGGLAPRAAAYAGLSEARAIWASLLVGGLCAGLAGAAEVAGPLDQLQRTVASGYGYSAIIVAYLGGLHPIGIVGSAFLMAVLFIGATRHSSRPTCRSRRCGCSGGCCSSSTSRR